MTYVVYDTSNLIDWSNHHDKIIEQFKSKQNTGLSTFFHGHIVLFKDIKFVKEIIPQKPHNFVDFEIINSEIHIPSHGLVISKYLIDIRSDDFEELSLDIFIKFFPECSVLQFTSSRKSLSWKAICEFESRIYDGTVIFLIKEYLKNKQENFHKILPKKIEPIIFNNTQNKIIPSIDDSDYQNIDQYQKNLFQKSKSFCKFLANSLPKNAKVLDLGSEEVPWFSFLCAENNLQVFAYDMKTPAYPDLLKKKGITFITDDVNNIGNHKDLLHDFDFIFCRNLSPAQRFWDWYDPDFLKIWKTLIGMINDKGVIYWEQMTNGTGKPDTFFMNHDARYFDEFFKKLDVISNITTYGYMRFKIVKDPNASIFPWNSPLIGKNSISSNDDLNDLLKNKDFASLIKNYAMQIQYFFEKNNFETCHTVEITGDKISIRILRILLMESFHYDDVVITDSSKTPSIKIRGDTSKFILDVKGFGHNDYFLIDEEYDLLRTNMYLKMLNRFPLYIIQKKYPQIINLKKKYFKRFKFWSE